MCDIAVVDGLRFGASVECLVFECDVCVWAVGVYAYMYMQCTCMYLCTMLCLLVGTMELLCGCSLVLFKVVVCTECCVFTYVFSLKRNCSFLYVHVCLSMPTVIRCVYVDRYVCSIWCNSVAFGYVYVKFSI